MAASAATLAKAKHRPTREEGASARVALGWPASVLFLSGVAGLVFQVLWIKQLSLVYGVEVYAVTAAVSAFFLGLALGGLVLGPLTDRVQRPVRFYAFLEASVAILSVAATLALARVAPLFAALERDGA